MKYYAVAKGRKTGIFTAWADCERQVKGFSGAVYKSFGTEAEAKRFMSGNAFLSKGKTCILCSKPIVKKSELCVSCKQKKKKLNQTLNLKYSISNALLMSVKAVYKCDDVFKFLSEHPEKAWAVINKPKAERKLIRHDYKEQAREIKRYSKGDPIPVFVKELLGDSKTAISVTGDKRNPNIIYVCHRCGETLYTRYSDYKAHAGHNCEGIKSSGEAIVEQYLKKNGIAYKTQRDTLKCVNPDTGFVMPYDFELSGRRILIEVQGEQHRKFIPRFHITQEAFEYQQKKDRYKKAYAESKGYRLIEIWYEDLTETRLKEILGDKIPSTEKN